MQAGRAVGAFSHSARTAPINTLFIPGTPLKTTHLQKDARSIQNSIGGAEFRTLGPVASIRLKKKIPGVPAGGAGCRIQDPRIRGYRWWKTADFSHSAGTAHSAPPVCVDARCVLWAAHLHGGRSRPHAWWASVMAALGTPCCSAWWCSCSSHKAHAMVPPGPAQAFIRHSRALARASQTFCDGCGSVWFGVVWCGVVQCGAVWCGVLCCVVAVQCGALQCGAVWCAVWCCVVHCCVVHCSGAVWCGVLCCVVAVQCGALQCGAVWCAVWCCVVHCCVVHCSGAVWCGVLCCVVAVQCGALQCGAVWCAVRCCVVHCCVVHCSGAVWCAVRCCVVGRGVVRCGVRCGAVLPNAAIHNTATNNVLPSESHSASPVPDSYANQEAPSLPAPART